MCKPLKSEKLTTILHYPRGLLLGYTGGYTSTVNPSRWGFVFLDGANPHLLPPQAVYVVVGLYIDRCI